MCLSVLQENEIISLRNGDITGKEMPEEMSPLARHRVEELDYDNDACW